MNQSASITSATTPPVPPPSAATPRVSERVLLTIVTICLNEASRIRRTLDSVVAQTDPGFEWIVIDGGSTDGTLDILRGYRSLITTLVSEPDAGIFDAMNRGLALSKGDYLLFLNAGDCFHNPDVVRRFRDTAPRTDTVVGGVLVVHPDGRQQYRGSGDYPPTPDFLYWRSFPHPSTFIRKRLFDRHGPYDIAFPLAADWEFFVRTTVRHGCSVASWDYPVSVFTNDGVSAAPANRPALHAERRRIRRRHYPLPYRLRREVNEQWGALAHMGRRALRGAAS